MRKMRGIKSILVGLLAERADVELYPSVAAIDDVVSAIEVRGSLWCLGCLFLLSLCVTFL